MVRRTQDFVQDIVDYVESRWQMILGLLTATTYLSGLAYFHGFLGRFGFRGIVDAISPTTILAYGGITAVLGIFSQGLMVLLAVALGSWLGSLIRRGRPGPPRMLVIPPPLVAVAFVVVMGIVVAPPWLWLAPSALAFIEATFPYSSLVLALTCAISYGTVLASLEGRRLGIFIVIFLLASTPATTMLLGTQAATRILMDPDSSARVLVWEDSPDEAPKGYVLIHQQGGHLYLLLITTYVDDASQEERKLYKLTTLSVDTVHRVEFIPPGVEIERIRLHAPQS